MKKIYSVLLIMTMFVGGLIGVKPANVNAAIISNRTIDDAWVFKLDDSTSTLTIQVKNGLESGGLATTKKTEAAWQDVWKKAYNDSTDIRPMVKHIKFITNDIGTKFDFNSLPTAYMFNGFTNLEDIDFSGVVQDSEVAETMRGMFQNCSKLKEVDLSWMATKDNSLQNMQDLFNGCSSLEKVTLNNPKFITRTSTKDSSGNVTSGAAQMGRMFQGCSKLKEIDMSNITLYGRDGNWTQITNVFTGNNLPAIETIKMDNIKLPNYTNLDYLFTNLKTLTNFSMKSNSPGNIAPDVETMTGMFKNSFTSPSGSGEVTLDISGLGKLDNIVNMDDFIAGCSGLEKLVFDNLDNSVIGPTNSKHSITPGQTGYVTRDVAKDIGAKEFGREIFGKGEYDIPSNFPDLKTISAKNSKIWLVKNNRGLPGNEYYDAASDQNILYFTNKKTTLNGVLIEDKRDYIDIITDRALDNAPTLSGTSEIADKSTNINVLNNLNTNSAGVLAPGVYQISDDPFDELKDIENPAAYYAIHYIGRVRPTVELIDDHNGDIVLTQGSENLHYLTTKNMTRSEWGDGTRTIPFKAVITYPDAAIDVNGKKHDIKVTINSVTFKDQNKIPSYAAFNGNRTHDDNNYWDSLRSERSANNSQEHSFYRTILQATKEDGLIFQNYARVGDPTTPWNYTQILTGGAGTIIDYSIAIDKANPDTTFVFYANDLDVAASQNWNRPRSDADYDNLPIENNTFGLGGESIEFVSGTNINDVKFAEKTGLTKSGNTVITTGTDPSTSWSEFKVASKADGAGSKYKWISGISCNSYMLLNTDPMPLSNIEFEPIEKVLDGGTLTAGQFEFTLTPDSSVSGNKATGAAITKTNDENGYVDFGFVFNNPQITIDGNNYYPGTNDNSTQDQNTHGNGTHNKYTYAWTVTEKDGGDENILYDLGPKQLKVIISTPENDAEMLKGIKAEVYVDGELAKTVWSKEVKDNKHVSAMVFKNVILKEVTLKNTWDDLNDKYGLRPDDLPGFITYEFDGKKTTVETEANKWVKTGNTWAYKFKLPKTAKIINWGEKSVPKGYTFTKGPNADDVYEMTNSLKAYDLTISKQVTGNDSDKTKEFNFTIKIIDSDDKAIAGKFTINGKEVSIAESGYKFTLKHGESLVIKDLLEGYTYEVEEKDTDYKESYRITKTANGDLVKKDNNSTKASSKLTEDQTVTFENSKNKSIVPQTGIISNKYVWLIALLTADISLGALYFSKRKLKQSN